MTDRPKKAKALAAINAGIRIVGTFDGGFWPVGDTRVQGDTMRTHKVYDKHYPTRIDALAAAADALGLSPDPDVMGEGLTGTQRAWIYQALAEHIERNGPITSAAEALGVLERYERNHLTRLQQKGG